MIDKKTFKKVMIAIQYQNETDYKVAKALELVMDGHFTFNTENKIYGAAFDLLKEVMEDESDMISWWLYEDVEKVIWQNGKEISVRTLDELYDYLKGAAEVGANSDNG